MVIDNRKSKYAKVYSVPQEQVSWTNGFWNDRFNVCADVTMPHIREKFEDTKEIFHNVENFRVAAGIHEGTHKGTPFADGDFYKWLESAMYVFAVRKDEQLGKDIDDYIELIGKAQQDDGYISTKQIIASQEGKGNTRNSDINDFEVYNFGHLFTAACNYYRLTGKSAFLDIAKKASVYLEEMYKEAEKTGEVQTAVCPSHYMGLVEMYRTIGDERYLDLAVLSIKLRDGVEHGTDDNQDRIPLLEQREIVGHGVRSTYLYAGVADVYLETGDERYLPVLNSCWEDLMQKKIYITGGCGALYQGVSPMGIFLGDMVHQAFGYEYQLPNITAYNETCATLGNIFWSHRMFAIQPQAKYFDIIERSMYNLALAAVSLDGDKYFYENMLRRTKSLGYELMWPLERAHELICFCCPPNLARVLAQTAEYSYMLSDDSVYTGLYGSSELVCEMKNGASFTLVQETGYPWNGNFSFTCKDVKQDVPFTLKIRVPSWLETGSIRINGELLATIGEKDSNSYIDVPCSELNSLQVEVVFELTPRLVIAHPKVEENTNQVAVERGPIVYCIEGVDQDIETIDTLMLPASAQFSEKEISIKDTSIIALETEGAIFSSKGYQPDALYQTLKEPHYHKIPMKLIPYFAWDNRGFSEMKIWLPLFLDS